MSSIGIELFGGDGASQAINQSYKNAYLIRRAVYSIPDGRDGISHFTLSTWPLGAPDVEDCLIAVEHPDLEVGYLGMYEGNTGGNLDLGPLLYIKNESGRARSIIFYYYADSGVAIQDTFLVSRRRGLQVFNDAGDEVFNSNFLYMDVASVDPFHPDPINFDDVPSASGEHLLYFLNYYPLGFYNHVRESRGSYQTDPTSSNFGTRAIRHNTTRKLTTVRWDPDGLFPLRRTFLDDERVSSFRSDVFDGLFRFTIEILASPMLEIMDALSETFSFSTSTSKSTWLYEQFAQKAFDTNNEVIFVIRKPPRYWPSGDRAPRMSAR